MRHAGLFLLLALAGLTPAMAQEVDLQPVTHEELHEAIREDPAALKVVNFWATWCGPCRQEFPYFVEVGQDFADEAVNVHFVSVDFAEDVGAAEDFLVGHGVSGLSFLKTGPDEPFINAVHTAWSGALPATFFYGPDGHLLAYHEGAFTREQLRERITQLLHSQPANRP